MDFFLGEMLCYSFGDLLCGNTAALEALHEELTVEEQLVTVNNAENKRVLILVLEG
jgi:hypothetical protein